MVDQETPTNQFHPYQPPDTTPVSEQHSSRTGLRGLLSKIGLDGSKLQNVDVRGSLEKARGYAREHPGTVLAGFALAVIGAGLFSRRKSHR